MSRPSEFVNKALIAKELGISASRVSQLVKSGLPTRKDGKIHREKALKWYQDHVRPRLKPDPKPAAAPSPAKTLPRPQASTSDDSDTLRELFETLIRKSGRIPEILCALGVRDAAVLAVSSDIFLSLTFMLAPDELFDLAYPAGTDCGDTPQVDLPSLALKHSFSFDPTDVRMTLETEELSRAEKMLMDFDEALTATE